MADQINYARCALAHKTLTRSDRIYAHCTGGAVPGAVGNADAWLQALGAGHWITQRCGHSVAFHQTRHMVDIETEVLQQVAAPAARAYIEPQVTGSVGHVAEAFASELQAQPVLG
jgi:hypothetical protein